MSVRAVAGAATLVVGLATAVAGCGGDDDGGAPPADPSATSTSATPSPTVPSLPTGKSDLDVPAGSYLSPEGFAPALQLQVPSGWTSVHRGADGFDLGQPDPDKDAPLVAVVFLTPEQAAASDALSAVRAAAEKGGAKVQQSRASLASSDVAGLDIKGGSGQLVASRDGGIALDAAPGQEMQVLGLEVEGQPLLVVVLVPDASTWDAVQPDVKALLDGVSPAPR